MKSLEIKEVLMKIERMPVLPSVSHQLINKELEDYKDREEIARIVELDQSLVVNILKVANSAYYGRSRQIISIRDAIVLLGLSTLKSLFLSLSVINIFENSKTDNFYYSIFWRHSIGCAVISKAIANHISGVSPEETFVAGILHDIGKLFMFIYFPEEYNIILDKVIKNNAAIIEAENEVLTDHPTVGKWIMERWNLPSFFRDVTWLHHQDLLLHPLDDKEHKTAAIIQLADLICIEQEVGLGDLYNKELKDRLLKKLELKEVTLTELNRSFSENIQNLADDLGIKPIPKDTYYNSLQKANSELGNISLRLNQAKERSEKSKREFQSLYRLGLMLQPDLPIDQVVKILLEHIISFSKISRAECRVNNISPEKDFFAFIKKTGSGHIETQISFIEAKKEMLCPVEPPSQLIKFDIICNSNINGFIKIVSLQPDLTESFANTEYLSALVQTGSLAIERTLYNMQLRQRAEEVALYSRRVLSEQIKNADISLYYKNIVNNAPVGIVTVNMQGVIINVNPFLLNLLCLRREFVENQKIETLNNLIGTNLFNLIKDSLSLPSENLKKRIEVLLPNRTRLTLSVDCVSLENSSGGKYGVICIVRDITKEMEMTSHLIQSEKLIGLGTLAMGMAHELNNPLQGVQTFAEAITSEEDLSVIKEYANKILANSERVSSIIKELLGYSRSTNVTDLCSVQVNDILQETLHIIKHTCNSDDVEIKMSYGNLLPNIYVNQRQIEQVFVNVIKNSLDAMENGGELRIESALTDNMFITVTISDTGKGIAASIRNQVFDPFFTTKEAGKGVGLGLFISQLIIQNHNGEIFVSSVEGKETKVKIKLPIHKDHY